MEIREAKVIYGPRVDCPENAVRSPAEAADFFRRIIGDDPREHFVALMLDGRHRPQGWHVVSVGTLTSSLVHPREVFRVAIATSAAAIIVAHNHPSGDTSPSAEDRTATRRLKEAGDLLGIPVLDSLVVSDSSHCSLND